jgi:hypothetical protein
VQLHSLVSQVLPQMMVRLVVVAPRRVMETADKMIQHLADRNPALILQDLTLLVRTHPAQILPALALPEAIHWGPRAHRALGRIVRDSLRTANLRTDSHQGVEYPAVKATVRQAVEVITPLEAMATILEGTATTLLAVMAIVLEAMAIILRVTTPTILQQRNKPSLLTTAIIRQVVMTTILVEELATIHLEAMATIPLAETVITLLAETATIHLEAMVTTLLAVMATIPLEVTAIILRLTTPTILLQRNKLGL